MNVNVKRYSDIAVNKKEIFRYAGVKDGDENFSSVVEDAIKEFDGKQKFSVCFVTVPVKIIDGEIDFSVFKVKSKSLEKCLNGCDSAVIFVATIGLEIDRLIKKYSSLSISKAISLNALGTERVESLCDKFCEELAYKVAPCKTTMRFSPGYGDLPLEVQKDIFSVLDCSRKIGVSLNESLLMSPSKSVSAIVGISNKNDNACMKKGCKFCDKKDCEFRG